MANIFLSHSRDDAAYAEQLAKALDSEVMRSSDYRELAFDEGVGIGMSFVIREADAVVVLVSEQALKSGWVMTELGIAWGTKKRIIPVLVPDSQLRNADVEGPLSTLYWLEGGEATVSDIALRIEKAIAE